MKAINKKRLKAYIRKHPYVLTTFFFTVWLYAMISLILQFKTSPSPRISTFLLTVYATVVLYFSVFERKDT
ncbi:polyferredoxin [Bhargavaea ullalensis]|uniref:Polyferredoxin n=1 Tax=Bhargavaea ullalensis TaxID=1265685 RepID=A0ABV2GE12_9BACL